MRNNYHDSRLTAIESMDDRVILKITLPEGKIVSLSLLEPKLFRVSDYIIGNSTSRLFMMNEKYEVHAIEEKLIWASSLDGTATHLSKNMLEKYSTSVKNQELSLLILEPNWGAEVVVLCRSIDEP